MALNPSGAISLAGPSAGQSIAVELGVSATATISLNDTNVRTLAQVASGVIVMPTDFYGKSNAPVPTQKAIFGFGNPVPVAVTSITNLVSSTGVVASDTPGVGTARVRLAAATYGVDKAIFGYGSATPLGPTSVTNLVSNTGVVSSNTPGVGANKQYLAATGYGNDKAMFGFGDSTGETNSVNLVSNTGVVASDTPGIGTARYGLAAAGYGGDGKAIFGYGVQGADVRLSMTNLVSNTGVVATDTPGVGTARYRLAAAGYGGDKAIFGYGFLGPTAPASTRNTGATNLVSNTGVVAANIPTIAPERQELAAAGYGGDKAIFGFGGNPATPVIATTNLVSNTGVVAAATPGVGTSRRSLAAAGYSTTA
jgi:hypothetical protein